MLAPTNQEEVKMKTRRVLLAAFVALAVSACASSYRVVQVPQYGADLYPQSQTRAGVTVAIDEMKAAERVERLFGADLVAEGILPVNIVVSNFGKQRLLVKPSDVLLHRGRDVIDPLPVEMVMAMAKRQKSFLRASTGEEVDRYFEQAVFKESALYPNETYRGVLFFAVPAQKRVADRFFTSLSVFRDGGPKMRVGLTNVESGERVLFAPFPITLPGDAGRFSYWD
jgi:hypothetical protein